MSEPARIGLLGRGTVGGAFAVLLDERASAVEAMTGRRPQLSGVLRRGEGDFGEILAASDLIVELIGGIEPAREYVLAALAAGRPVVTANKQLIAQHGGELFSAARDAGVQLRFEAAVAGAIPVIRVVQESLGALEIERREKRIGSSLEAAPTIYVADTSLSDAFDGLSVAEIMITSGGEIVTSAAPDGAFTQADVGGVAVVPGRAEGDKCARSWRIVDDVGADSDYPDLSARDARAVREWEARGAATG